MGKRKEAARATDSTEQANNTEQAEKLETASEPPADQLPAIPSPTLVPAQVASAAPEIAPEIAPASDAHIDRQSALDITPVSSDVVTVSFDQAAAEAATRAQDRAGQTSAIAAYLRARRFLPLAATVAIAALVGALTGALATSGMSRLMASEDTSRSASLPDNRLLQETIAKFGADLATLKTNIESSAKTAGTQFARLGERLDRADRAQAESTGKLAKLTESLDRHGSAATASAASVQAAADPVVTGSIPANSPPQLSAPATRPAGQPIVEGWVLRQVANGAALIQGRIGLVEVEPGDNLPGLGRVQAIRRLEGRWVVVTNRGLITAR